MVAASFLAPFLDDFPPGDGRSSKPDNEPEHNNSKDPKMRLTYCSLAILISTAACVDNSPSIAPPELGSSAGKADDGNGSAAPSLVGNASDATRAATGVTTWSLYGGNAGERIAIGTDDNAAEVVRFGVTATTAAVSLIMTTPENEQLEIPLDGSAPSSTLDLQGAAIVGFASADLAAAQASKPTPYYSSGCTAEFEKAGYMELAAWSCAPAPWTCPAAWEQWSEAFQDACHCGWINWNDAAARYAYRVNNCTGH